jgi:hypothetical protein
MRAFAEADKPSQLFEYYLLDARAFSQTYSRRSFRVSTITPFRPQPTLPTTSYSTIGAVRCARAEARLPTDPKDPEAFIDIFTDLSGIL